jgi:hypothetical protein
MQVIEIPYLLESASADFVGVVAVLTAEPFSNALLAKVLKKRPDCLTHGHHPAAILAN